MKTWRFITLLLTALSMGMSFAHLLELPPRIFYFDAELWITMTTEGLYALFGSVGGPIEVASVLTAIVLVFLVRRRGSSFYLTLGGAICVTVALVSWFIFIAPANAQFATWTPTSYPQDWTRWRNQWEYTHAVNAIIKIIGFSLLILSIIIETPKILPKTAT